MKKIAIVLSALFVLTAFTTHVDKYTADVTKSKLVWKAEKVTGGHDGHVSLKSGNVFMDHGKIAKASFVVDMNTITNDDIKSEKYSNKLVGHLKSEDFFNVKKHPEVSFDMIKATPVGNGKFDVFGNITIKGIQGVISFPMMLKESKSELEVSGTFSFDRTKFDIKYDSGSFFENLGDRAINDEVVIDFNIVLYK
jgi:polyisoprenoid-binding protein YceI